MAGKVSGAVKWLQAHSEKLGKKYKDKWLAINSKGVLASSESYAKVANEAAGKDCLLIKVPKYPQTTYVY